MSKDAAPLPPGGPWFPLIGETLSFLASPFDFIDRRVKSHGPIFRTHLLGKSTVILAGGETASVFSDEKTCKRDGSMPDHVRELFGGRSLPLLDGAEHVTRKRQVLAALVPETFADYLPDMQAIIERTLADAAGKGPIDGIAALKRLAISIIAKNIVGMEDGPDLEKLLASYQVLLAGFTGLPIPLPGTVYRKALFARDAILEVLGRAVAEHRKDEKKWTDGLAHVLAHRDERGAAISDDAAAMELHHIFIAGYIVYALLASVLVELDRNPELRSALRAEVMEHAPAGTFTLRQVGSMRKLGSMVQEAKRFTPVVPLSFGTAKTTFEVGGYTIPEGTMLYWAPYAHNQDAAVYESPRTFDPDRYGEGRAEHGKHAFAFAPQGMGAPNGHKCAGVDYSTLLIQVFAAVVLRDYTFSLPEQDLTLNLAQIPPEPKSNLQVAFERGADDAKEGEARPSQRRLVRPSELPPLVHEDPLGLEALLALAEIAWADGRMAKEEAEALVQIARSLGLDEGEVAMVERVTRERPGPSQGQPLALGVEESEHLFTLACLVAAADGDVDPREHAAIAGLGDRLQLDAAARERAATAARAVGGAIRESSVLRVVAKELDASLPS